MLSVDSGGNFRYCSGGTISSLTATYAQCASTNSATVLSSASDQHNLSKILSQQGIITTKRKKMPLGAYDLISAFEALPERANRNNK